MGETKMVLSVVEQCQVWPPTSVADASLPLTFFDMKWLLVPPVSRLLLYSSPNSKSDSLQTLLPNLKHSLSLALKHYFPFAGNSVVPSSFTPTTIPQIRYLKGDSVSLTVAECTCPEIFNHLIGNHPRDVDDLTSLVPQLPPAISLGDCLVSPLLAVQITFFPNYGVAIGFKASHVAADGKSLWNFIRTWALIAKHNDAETSTLMFPVPFYDRGVIKDPRDITSTLWSQYLETKRMMQENPLPQPAAGQAIAQTTVVMYQADIQELKKLVLAKLPSLGNISSFTVVCAYLWSCMVKARVALGQDQSEDNIFAFMIDCRSRMNPPIPDTYFGNCLVGCSASRKSMELLGEEGIVGAAQGITEAIHTKLNKEDGGALKGEEMWFTHWQRLVKQQMFWIAGSPKFDYYTTADFGWGNPIKVEAVSQKCSLISQGESWEIGLCFPIHIVQAFTRIFAANLASLIRP